MREENHSMHREDRREEKELDFNFCNVHFRAHEWDVNKWAWEGVLKVVSKGEECIIRLEDKNTGELYARGFLRNGEPHPVEPVIDSSRYFVLLVRENIDHTKAKQKCTFLRNDE